MATSDDTLLDTMIEEEKFEVEVVIGNIDLYDDILSEDSITKFESEPKSEGTELVKPNMVSKYPLSLGKPDTSDMMVGTKKLNTEQDSSRFDCLIGNLTWWTTGQEIQTAIESLGVFDIVEIKFFENRATGISRGFCSCVTKSDESIKLIHENLVHEQVHGKRFQVMHNTEDAVAYFESQDILRPKQKFSAQLEAEKENISVCPPIRREPRFYGPVPVDYLPRFPSRFPLTAYPNGFRHFPVPFRYRSQYPACRPPLTYPHPMSYRPYYAPRPQRGPNEGYVSIGQETTHALPSKKQLTMSSSPISPPGNSTAPWSSQMSPLATSSPLPGRQDQTQLHPQPHVNPGFLPRGCVPDLKLPSASASAQPKLAQHSGEGNQSGSNSTQLSRDAHEAAMDRVKVVASTAMARAVKDAASGDYGDSIETLVTAISLLRQSKVVNDRSVKILIASLQDTLEEVENESYCRSVKGRAVSHSRSLRHHRERCRSRSPRSHVSRYYTKVTHSSFARSQERDEYVPRMKHEYRSRSQSRGGGDDRCHRESSRHQSLYR